MASRANDQTALQSLLEELLGSRNVYFQPPESIKMQYPAIVYEFTDIRTECANNLPYKTDNRYTITLIHRDPTNEIIDKLKMLRTCRFVRCFKFEGLYNFVFDLYF